MFNTIEEIPRLYHRNCDIIKVIENIYIEREEQIVNRVKGDIE